MKNKKNITHYEILNNNKIKKYNNWLNKKNKNNIENLNYIKFFFNNIKEILEKHNIEIDNEKQFREEIGLFIYRYSSE